MIGELSRLTGKAARRRADELLEQFDLTDAAGRAVKTYSGGMRRRLDLAASLIGHPAVLFLDEPTTGLDPSARALMWDIVRRLVADGTTLLLTTQYLDEADQLADRIAVIDGGKVIAEGTPTELKASMGGQRLLITLAEGSDASAAAAALRPFTTASIIPNEWDRLIEAPVTATDGLATEVVRALDAAGVKVNDIAVRSASLDDVFLTLTGRKAEDNAEENEKQEVLA
jgi:ABC-type multidrug transport system ATPase subunit